MQEKWDKTPEEDKKKAEKFVAYEKWKKAQANTRKAKGEGVGIEKAKEEEKNAMNAYNDAEEAYQAVKGVSSAPPIGRATQNYNTAINPLMAQRGIVEEMDPKLFDKKGPGSKDAVLRDIDEQSAATLQSYVDNKAHKKEGGKGKYSGGTRTRRRRKSIRKKHKKKKSRKRKHRRTSEKGRAGVGFGEHLRRARDTAVRVIRHGPQAHIDRQRHVEEVNRYMEAFGPLLREKGVSEADIQGLTELFKEAPVHFHRMQRDPGYYFEQMRGHNVRGRAYRPQSPLRRGQTQSSPTRRRSSRRRSSRRRSSRRSKPSRARSV